VSLGDAIIAATSLVHDRALVTRNVDDFRWIAGIRLIDPFAAPPAP
jgi:predicted nucleic acid-binding protein